MEQEKEVDSSKKGNTFFSDTFNCTFIFQQYPKFGFSVLVGASFGNLFSGGFLYSKVTEIFVINC